MNLRLIRNGALASSGNPNSLIIGIAAFIVSFATLVPLSSGLAQSLRSNESPASRAPSDTTIRIPRQTTGDSETEFSGKVDSTPADPRAFQDSGNEGFSKSPDQERGQVHQDTIVHIHRYRPDSLVEHVLSTVQSQLALIEDVGAWVGIGVAILGIVVAIALGLLTIWLAGEVSEFKSEIRSHKDDTRHQLDDLRVDLRPRMREAESNVHAYGVRVNKLSQEVSRSTSDLSAQAQSISEAMRSREQECTATLESSGV